MIYTIKLFPAPTTKEVFEELKSFSCEREANALIISPQRRKD